MPYFYENKPELTQQALRYHRMKRNLWIAGMTILTAFVGSLIFMDFQSAQTTVQKPYIFILVTAVFIIVPIWAILSGYKSKLQTFEGKVHQFYFMGTNQTLRPMYTLLQSDGKKTSFFGPMVARWQMRKLEAPLQKAYTGNYIKKFAGIQYPEVKGKRIDLNGFCHVCGKINKEQQRTCTRCSCDLP